MIVNIRICPNQIFGHNIKKNSMNAKKIINYKELQPKENEIWRAREFEETLELLEKVK